MKKLNKLQKQKLKDTIFKILHVIGYVSIGVVVLFSIVLGVNGCNTNKTQDHIALRENNNKSVIDLNNVNASTLYNIDDYGRIKVTAHSVYYVNPNRFNLGAINALSCVSFSNASANEDIYIVEYHPSTNAWLAEYLVRVKDIYLGSNGLIYGHDALDNSETLLCGYNKYLLVFDSDRYWNSNYDYYNNFRMFDECLIYVDNTWHYESYGDYETLSYYDYQEQVRQYWVEPASYLYPFVIEENNLLNNPTVWNYLPIQSYNSSDTLINTYSFVGYHNGYLEAYENDNTTHTHLHLPRSVYQNQVLGIHGASMGVYYKTYAGCYKWHTFYKYYLNYSFAFGGQASSISNTYVNTCLIYQVNLFNVYRRAEQEGFDSSTSSGLLNYLTIFYNSQIFYNGVLYDRFELVYNYGYSPWNLRYSNSNTGVKYVYSYGEALFNGSVYYANYSVIYDTLDYAYKNDEFTKLLGRYDPNYIYEDNSAQYPPSDYDNELTGVFGVFAKAFDSVGNVLNISIFGGITVGSLLLLPLVVSIVLFVIHLFKR